MSVDHHQNQSGRSLGQHNCESINLNLTLRGKLYSWKWISISLKLGSVGTTSGRVEMLWRIITKHRTKQIKKKAKTQILTMFSNLPTSWGQKGREFLLNQPTTRISGAITSLYIGMEFLKKKNQQLQIRIRNEFRHLFEFAQNPLAVDSPRKLSRVL